MKKMVTRILDKFGFVLAACIVLAALLVSISRLLTPVLMEHRADFEKFVSAQAGRPVMIKEITIRWHGYEPQISLEGITILDPQEHTPILEINRLEVDFNIWRSIWAHQFFIQSLTVAGLDLTIHHQENDKFEIGNLGAVNMQDTATGHSVHADVIFNWIFSQPRLALEDIALHYIPLHYPERSITLKALALRNSPTHHVLDGKATLNQEMPVNVDVHLGWDGDIRKLPEANGHVYLYFEGLSLPQWFGKYSWQGLQVTQGLASTKLWLRWNKNQIYKMQTTFEIYNLQLYSSVTKNAQMINRISGNLGWKIVDDVQTIAGDGVYLDLPNHLWPATSFNMQAKAAADDNLTVQNVKFNYADIADVKRFLLMTSVLSDDARQKLLHLDASGQIQDFQADLPADLSDIQHWTISGKLQNFNVDAWQQWPTMRNFSGSGSWNGKDGAILLASNKLSVTASHYFDAPISLEDLSGNIKFSRDDVGTLTLNTTNLHLANADLLVDVKGNVSVPQNDSATVDINVNYKVVNLGKLATYLPAKIMDPELGIWLKHAFVSGQTDAGRAIIQGNMKDFPFTTNNGKFLVSMQVKDLDLNYGPGWPHLMHINGDLTFAGSAMKTDVQSALLLDIPVQAVHAEIPYIGDAAPQVVNVDTVINTDLSNGLRFIRNSPLQNTIGKDFKGVNLMGSMQLKLSLSIPAKTPETAKVAGTITTNNATLALPTWKLTVAKLTGAVTFTEDSLSASNLQSEVFGAPAIINISTADQININLTSKISIATLQDWLSMRFDNIMQGSADYQVQLLLSSTQTAHAPADQLLISSNLQGVSVTLPAPYAKTADASTDFKVTIDLTESKYLKVKLAYAKLLSAAVALQNENQQLILYGGEIKLGSDSAAWQNAPGILVTGQAKELDVSTWQNYFDSLNPQDKNNPAHNFKLLRGIDLSATVLRAMNLALHNAHVQASMKDNAWDIQMNSNEIGGNLTLPFTLSGATVSGHLDHLTLDSRMAASTTKRLDPRTLPAMQFTIDNASYDEMKFGRVNLDLQPFSGGIQIKDLSINQPDLQLNATGQWTSGGTRLQGTVATPHISQVLQDWGFNSANLLGSTANFTFNLGWPGPPYAPSLAGLGGTLNLKFGEGKIINLSESTNSKIGLGKLLNIFSLSSIPSHLNFSSNKNTAAGFNFDTMTGDFTFRNGSAFTENMRIEGPVAAVAIKGRIGLQAKDLDLSIGVNAHVTGSLPLMAAFAAGPVVGIATLMVDKVVSSQISKVTSYDYTVTNSWANPVWSKTK